MESTLRYTKIAMENPPFEDVSPTRNGGFPLLYVSLPESIRVVIFRGSTKILTTKLAAEDKARRYDDLNESTLHRRKFRKQRLDAIQMLEAWGKQFFLRGACCGL